MTLVWLGIVMLTVGWMRALPVYNLFPGSMPWFLAGIALIVAGTRNNGFWHARVGKNWAVLLLFASILGIAWLDGTLRLGFFVLGIASLLMLVPLPRWLASSPSNSNEARNRLASASRSKEPAWTRYSMRSGDSVGVASR